MLASFFTWVALLQTGIFTTKKSDARGCVYNASREKFYGKFGRAEPAIHLSKNTLRPDRGRREFFELASHKENNI
jgi:hypothetical protein